MRSQIAKFGRVYWTANSEDAGPYHLQASWLTSSASFGTRDGKTSEPGSNAQVKAFHQSKAAFNALQLCMREGLKHAQRHQAIRAATEAARAEWSRWSFQFPAYNNENGYYSAVVDRLLRTLPSDYLAE